MMKEFISRCLSRKRIYVILFIIVALFQSCDCFELVERKKILIPKTNERIYLKSITVGGIGGVDCIVISKNRGCHIKEQYDYYCTYDCVSLYSIEDGMLTVYGCSFVPPSEFVFESSIRIKEVSRNELLKLYRDKDKNGMFVFPEQSEYILENGLKYEDGEYVW